MTSSRQVIPPFAIYSRWSVASVDYLELYLEELLTFTQEVLKPSRRQLEIIISLFEK